jgi:hypothetical protein
MERLAVRVIIMERGESHNGTVGVDSCHDESEANDLNSSKDSSDSDEEEEEKVLNILPSVIFKLKYLNNIVSKF